MESKSNQNTTAYKVKTYPKKTYDVLVYSLSIN